MGSLTGLCVVSRFTANDSKERIQYYHLPLISLEKKVRDTAKFYKGSLHSHENNVFKMSHFNTFYFLRSVHVRYVKCL